MSLLKVRGCRKDKLWKKSGKEDEVKKLKKGMWHAVAEFYAK